MEEDLEYKLDIIMGMLKSMNEQLDEIDAIRIQLDRFEVKINNLPPKNTS